MSREKIKSIAVFILIILMSTGFAMLKYPNESSLVLAEDESSEPSEESKEEEEEEYEYVTETVIVSPAKTVYEEQVVDVLLPDSDKDGIADKNDPHPKVAEIYVVKDEDKDGIDDEYERFFEKIRISK